MKVGSRETTSYFLMFQILDKIWSGCLQGAEVGISCSLAFEWYLLLHHYEGSLERPIANVFD